jgi:uncharacterized membrane protein YdjX (TVP38/TMEM64 family)
VGWTEEKFLLDLMVLVVLLLLIFFQSYLLCRLQILHLLRWVKGVLVVVPMVCLIALHGVTVMLSCFGCAHFAY